MATKLEEAIAAIKAGKKPAAKQLLIEMLEDDPNNENAWLWMTQVAVSDSERIEYLQNILRISPDNELVKKGLAKLQAATKLVIPKSEPKPKPIPEPAPTPIPEPSPVPILYDEPTTTDEDKLEAVQQPDSPPEKVPFLKTDRGMLIAVSGLVGLILILAACIIITILSQPYLVQLPPTIDAILGTETATSTLTPIPPTSTDIPDTPTITLTPTSTSTMTPTMTSTPVVADTSTVTPTPTRTGTAVSADSNIQEGLVVGVIEGDIIDVVIGGSRYQVRYILVNAPTASDEPYGTEALKFNRSLVDGQTVKLEKDITDTDDAGRLLRYVYIGDTMVNEELLRRGLAQVQMISPDLKYGNRLQTAERTAKDAGLGIWAK